MVNEGLTCGWATGQKRKEETTTGVSLEYIKPCPVQGYVCFNKHAKK